MKTAIPKSLLNRLEKVKSRIGKQRDELREIQDEINALEYPVEQGLEALDCAISTFSEAV